MTELTRRMWFRGAVAMIAMPAFAANKREAHRFLTADFEIEITVDYHDGYSSSGFWFRQGNLGRQFCLSADGERSRECLTNFRGSLAIAQYRILARSGNRKTPRMREYVRTVDRDARLRDRPPFERAIELKSGMGSDLQAFGFEALPAEEEAMFEAHSPWYLFRQDLFLEPQHQPFLAIFWKHAFSSIRMLDVIPGEQTCPSIK